MRLALAPATVLIALVPASVASAATIATSRPCLNSESPAQFVGSGFTPGALVKVTGPSLAKSGVAGPDGSVAIPFTAPLSNDVPPAPLAFQATDGTNAASGEAPPIGPLAAAEGVTGTASLKSGSDVGSLWPFIRSQAVRGEFPLSYLRDEFGDLPAWKRRARGELLELLH